MLTRSTYATITMSTAACARDPAKLITRTALHAAARGRWNGAITIMWTGANGTRSIAQNARARAILGTTNAGHAVASVRCTAVTPGTWTSNRCHTGTPLCARHAGSSLLRLVPGHHKLLAWYRGCFHGDRLIEAVDRRSPEADAQRVTLLSWKFPGSVIRPSAGLDQRTAGSGHGYVSRQRAELGR